MKGKKKKAILAWVLGVGFCLLIPTAFIGKAVLTDLRSKVGRNKSLLNDLVVNNYAGKTIDDVILETSRNQVHTVFLKALKEKGKFVELGVADTIPSISDALGGATELSYNLPVRFEKGYVTFTFRVKNEDDASQRVVWAEVVDGVLPHDDMKMRLRKHLP